MSKKEHCRGEGVGVGVVPGMCDWEFALILLLFERHFPTLQGLEAFDRDLGGARHELDKGCTLFLLEISQDLEQPFDRLVILAVPLVIDAVLPHVLNYGI